MKIKHYFSVIAIPLTLLYWVIESTIHYYSYGELEFEIIPSDSNELWMRITFFIFLILFAIYADYISTKRNKNIETKIRSENISRAKKQWELIVDSLPQLVIAIDHNARITRVNRIIETWGIGKVDKVDGLYVPDFLKSLNDSFSDYDWTSDWTYLWQQIKSRDTIEKKIEKESCELVYQFSLNKISDYDTNKDQCYAVLIIDDITASSCAEKSLKNHAQELENKVNTRTIELQHANIQLKHELDAKKATNLELKNAQDCRLALLRDIFTAQEMERKRIAHELHDSIGQSLGATKFKAEELLMDKQIFTNDSDYKQLSRLVKLIKNAIDEVRSIAMDLRPAMLDDLGIITTLKWFCREYENTYNQIKINLSLDIDESLISDDRKVVIFRIVQEAMNNIAKHANATNVRIELSESDSGLRLCINDNGCGFGTGLAANNRFDKLKTDTGQLQCSFGLSSMRERAESTNGKFAIEPNPDSGTSVIVSWENKDTLSLDRKRTA